MKLLTLLILQLTLIGTFAQEHVVFSPISSINGLSDNRVRTINQLTDGRMVIITEGLVNIYDGAAFRYLHYNEQKAYQLKAYSGFHRAYVDNKNRLWLKNRYNLFLFDIGTEQFVPNIDSVLQSMGIKTQVADFFMDSNFNFWLMGINNQLILHDGQTNETTEFHNHILQLGRNNNDPLYDIALCNNQLFLFFQSGEMVCFNKETAQELYRENPWGDTGNPYPNTLMVVPHKQYLYQVRDGYNKGQLIRFNTMNRKWDRILETDYWLNTLTIDTDGTCWVSSLNGLWRIDENLNNKQLLSPLHLVDGRRFDCEISTQFNDNQGGLWVGTVNRGLLYYHPDRFKFRNYGSSLFSMPQTTNIGVTGIAENNDIVMIGTHWGLYSLNPNSKKPELYKQIPTNSNCEMLLSDSQNRLWLCTRNNGLFGIEGNKISHFDLPYQCYSLFETFDKRLFLCTNQGPGVFDAQHGTFAKASGLPLGNTYQLTTYSRDTLLGYSDKSLFFYHTKSNSVSVPDKDAPINQHNNKHYHCLYTDSRGLIWIGTGDGLYTFNTKTLKTNHFHTKDGLINNSIRSVIEDNQGRVWVSTANGISCITLTPNQQSYRFSFSNYNRFDGVIENEFLPRSVCKTTDGSLLWGGIDGFNEIELTQLTKPEPKLYQPLFTRFSLAGAEIKMGESHDGNIILKQSITTTQTIRLKHNQNFFSIDFSALNYINPSQTDYRFKLDGVDADWRVLTTTDGIGRINYTKLPTGTYQLNVQAAINQQWNGQTARLTIVIEPPFWKTAWAYALYLSFIIGLIYTTIAYYIHQKIKKNRQQQKEELDQYKFRFFTNISHELRTPLTLIITPLDSLIKKLNDDTVKSQLTGISHNAHELLNLVNQLLAFRKLEMNGETLNLGYCNLGEFLGTIVTPFNNLAIENGVHFEFVRPKTELWLYADQDKLRKMANNLLSNAFKFTPKGGEIRMTVEKDDAARLVAVKVADTGCGIADDEQTQIFDRFYQAKNQQNQTGSGIGLHLVNEYAQLHNGSATVQSKLGHGSVFTVTISSELKPQPHHTPTNSIGNSQTKLLVVDDHPEFRTFLVNQLAEKYTVILAADGHEALEKACDEQPDLIVSDVMMPVMDGTELCRQLKTDLNTSHIPVILLTAKTSDEAQIEGFEAGADAYIAKPFNMNILLLRIENLLEQQIKRKELFKKSIVIKPDALAISTVDESLISKAVSHIEKNLDNSSYSVEQLSRDMFMDRTGLYRKLTAITGLTPTEFIRSVRLKKAALLLQQGLTVSKVADLVGFGSSSYFTKCFQDEFGVKPSQYKNQQQVGL